VEVHPDRPSH